MKHDEQGIALVIVIFLMGTLSALAVSMMFLAQTETASSRNYRTMSQARYAAEAGVQSMANYLMSTTYATTAMPSTPFTGYDVTKSPVTCTSGCTHLPSPVTAACSPTTIATAVSSGCIVIGYSSATSNNPAGTVNSGASDTLAVNASGTKTNAAMGTVTYGAVAVLMSMRAVTPYGSAPTVIQTWQIVSDGTVPPSTAAIVEVSGALEREFGVAQTFAVFATGTGCGAISLSGNVQTASTSDGTTVVSSGGNVGTNGNMTIEGHVDVHGSLSSARTGVGTCTDGTGVTALTESGAATVDNGVVQLPQALTFPTPSLPSPMPPTSAMSASAATCLTVVALNATLNPGTTCVYSGSTATITPGITTMAVQLGNLSGNWVLNGGTYSVNSVGSGGLSTAGTSGVSINLAGMNSDGSQIANPFNLNGQAVVNSSMDASKLEILYAGTGSFDMTGGGANAAMLLYAPNASVTTHGNADFWGSLLVNSVTSAGTPRFIYDTRLQKKLVTLGNYMMTSFSWKKY